MGKRIVIALGGNALGKNLPEQMEAVQHTARAIVDLIEQTTIVINKLFPKNLMKLKCEFMLM